MIELKPCACGGDVAVIHHLDSHFEMVWGVECKTCGRTEDGYIASGYAIEAWNRRHEHDYRDETREA